MAPKKKGKKKPALGDWSDDDAVVDPLAQAASADGEQPDETIEQPPAQQAHKGKKPKGKKKKGKKDLGEWSDEDELPAATSATLDGEDDAEPLHHTGCSASRSASGFAALPNEEEGGAAANGAHAEEESDDGSEQVHGYPCMVVS